MKLNITTKFLSLFVAAALTLTSCGDDKDDAQPNIDTQTACKVTQIADDEGITSVATYNANGYITKVVQTGTVDEEEFETVIEYTYDNTNKLIKEEYSQDGEIARVSTYTYENGLVKTITSNSEWEDNYVQTLTYDGNNRVIKITDNEDYIETFTYSGNNVSEIVTTFMGELYYKVKYENYDNKLNPLFAIKGMVDLTSGSSKNNPGKETYTYYYEGEVDDVYMTTYTYQYNNNNLPTRITQTDEDGSYVTNLTYQCN